MTTWWILITLECWSGHSSLTFELIILLLASSQHHHHHVVCDRLGEEEGEEEGDHVINVYGDGNEANHGL